MEWSVLVHLVVSSGWLSMAKSLTLASLQLLSSDICQTFDDDLCYASPAHINFKDYCCVSRSSILQFDTESCVFVWHEKCESVLWSVWGWQADCLYVEKTVNVAIFLDTLNMINVRLCMMVVLIELYPLVFQGHSSVKQFQL